MQKNDLIRLKHMLDSAREAARFVEGKSRSDFDEDRILALALVKCIEIIGEAAANTSAECREHFPEIPWKLILGMRNRLVHAYFEIDEDVVWYTTTVSLPSLIQMLERIMEAESTP